MFNGLGKVLKILSSGSKAYKLWVGVLLVLIAIGTALLIKQLDEGLIATNMRDQVSWGWYIANFTFLVGVAAAAVVLVVPGYLYHYEPIKEIVILGEIMAVSAVVMCLVFVTIDMGSPERFWHLIPVIGIFNFPQSILAWDVLVLNVYLVLNLSIVLYTLYKLYKGEHYSKKIMMPLIILSIPAAINIHTVTAFIYAGIPARPFWNIDVLAPRFIASAFCSGPAFMLIIFQVIRKTTPFKIKDEALFKIGEIMMYAMILNLFFLFSETFTATYLPSNKNASHDYLWHGLNGYNQLVPWIWSALAFNLTAFLLLLIPKTRKKLSTLNLACVLLFVGIYIEKGLGLVVPGYIPSALGEIYEYFPNTLEIGISIGVWAFGLLVFTLLSKIAIAVISGELRCECNLETKCNR